MMATYECGVLLFMISLCCSRELHATTMSSNILDDDQIGGSSVIEKQSCPTWYREIKHNGMTRCVCGATLDGNVRCDDATLDLPAVYGCTTGTESSIWNTI